LLNDLERSFRETRSITAFKFEVVPIKDFTEFEVSSDFTRYLLKKRVVIASDIVLEKQGTYTIVFRVASYSGGCLVLGMEPEATRLTS
jgi:hypothetical protein